MFSPIHFASHEIMCISRCRCPVGGQCWNTYYSLMLEPIRLQPCHVTGSLRPRCVFFCFLILCTCVRTFGYDCTCVRPTWKCEILFYSLHVLCVSLEGCVHSVTPGCDPQLQISRSQEESPCAVSPIPSHTLTHALQMCVYVCVLPNLPLVLLFFFSSNG